LSATFAVNSNITAAATKLQDHKLLSKLAAGDMVAWMHASPAALYNRVRDPRKSKKIMNLQSSSLEAITLAELVMFIEQAPRPIDF